MQHKEYNGWYNYETRAVKLWLDNDEGAYNYMRERAGEVLTENTDEDGAIDADTFKSEFADCLKEYHDEQADEVMGDGATVFHALMRGALSEVNWYELAESYLTDAKEAAGVS